MDKAKIIFASVCTGVTYIFGGWDLAMLTLITFIVIDYLTGLLKAFVTKEISSAIGYKGIAKKGGIFVVLIISVALDRLLNTGNWVFRTLTCFFYIANEGISIIENLAAIGVPIPYKIIEVLAQIKDSSDKGEI